LSDHKWDEELVERLMEFADTNNPNRAVLAHLRRGLGESLDHTLGHVGWLFRRTPDFALDNAVLAAGLFAWAKGDCPHTLGVNFGTAFGATLDQEQKQRREKRFIDLLDTDRKELPYKLRQAITLISKDNDGLDWMRLIRHLGYWTHPSRRVQKDWARGFWSVAKTETNTVKERPVSE
jgi:CRISPR type I-E-associated protein CasB/Cse2